MTERFDEKFKRSYKDEYKVLYEAVYGTTDDMEEISDDESVTDDFNNFSLVARNNENNNVAYDDTDDYDTDDRWNDYVPDLVLEKIFDYLSMRDKYCASLVCRNWYRAFYLPNSWKTFVFNDATLTRRIFNYYSGWQHILDHLRVQLCLNKIGRFIKTLIFMPIYNFYNLYEFMNMISFYAERGNTNQQTNLKAIGYNITTLHYTFPCNMSTGNERRLYGTGGKLLEALKRLMKNLPSLRNLELVDLMLDIEEAVTFLDHICYTHCLIMEKLTVINISKTYCDLLHLGVFLNLQILVISPQSLGEDVLYLIGESKLRHLHIVQNSYTPPDITAPSAALWRKCAVSNPKLKVHLSATSKYIIDLLWQPCSLVSTVLFDSRFNQLNAEIINRTIDLYSNTLKTFGNLSIPRFHEQKCFHDRIDSFLVFLCDRCPLLETLVIRDKISTFTILLIVNTAKNLRSLHIRRGSVLLRADWPKDPTWTDDYYAWLKSTARSYDKVESEVSKVLQHRWELLTDKEFIRINPKLY